MHFPVLLATLLLVTLPIRAEPIDSIAAIVNNEAITCYEIQQDMEKTLKQLHQSGSTTLPSTVALKQRALDARIVKTLQMDEARKLDLKVSKEELNKAIERVESSNGMLPGQLKDALKQQGINVEQFKENLHDQILINKLINIAVRSKLQISEESIREYYRKYMAETKPRREMQLGHIFISLP
ncbi:MAG: SurA N-terminal domain-containing protein, partial [Mariprofundus sp.]|nr:SurA N-terminal domain-containing protein [Mariprofundus sp.]